MDYEAAPLAKNNHVFFVYFVLFLAFSVLTFSILYFAGSHSAVFLPKEMLEAARKLHITISLSSSAMFSYFATTSYAKKRFVRMNH
jgi:hypothetical protein